MPHQPRLIKDEPAVYEMDAVTKDAYNERLREKLQDPEFRRIEGFPIGEDEAILALSDPPFYTSCPNQFVPEIMEQWRIDRGEIRKSLGLSSGESDHTSYQRKPFAFDVSEGKSGVVYSAHTYHTKVPHKAIMHYILHYTDPGDIILDAFSGTGMTGVAAQMSAYDNEVSDLRKRNLDDDDGSFGIPGSRRVVLNDLSPAASFISANYNLPVDPEEFDRIATELLIATVDECSWMYETSHPAQDEEIAHKGTINFTVWSDVFICPNCGGDVVFWDVAVEQPNRKVRPHFKCPSCNTNLTKRQLDLVLESKYDSALEAVVKVKKQIPVLIDYSFRGNRYEKSPDEEDFELIRKIEAHPLPYWFPIDRMPPGDEARRNDSAGITHVHHFFFRRSLWLMSSMWKRINDMNDPRIRSALRFMWQSLVLGYTKLNRYSASHYSQVNRMLSGTLYVSSLISEISPLYGFRGKLRRLRQAFEKLRAHDDVMISTQSSTNLLIPDMSIDYIFIDPPFGSNLQYSELNFIWESWLQVRTNPFQEAVVNRTQEKALLEYQRLMEACFRECFRVLKSGRWITVEFHNSQNSIWNAIQESVFRAGFMIADVRTLDKKQGTFKQVSADSSVKQDLVISAYKPTDSLSKLISDDGTSEVETPWAFVGQHLSQIPVVVLNDGVIEPLSERQDYLLFDRMVAFHIQRGATVPLSAAGFYAGLRERFPERDGMFFLPEQIPAYEQARLKAQEVAQLALFVSDEKSAIQWLRQQLDPALGGTPQTYQALQPQFLRQLHQARHEALPELRDLLEENFLQDEGGQWYAPDPNKATDLEQLRQKSLLREFQAYVEGRKKLKQFRTEAVRAGFAHAWQERDYATIVSVAERLPQRVLQEDPDLLMYYDNASLRA